jgi:hypothetical protein
MRMAFVILRSFHEHGSWTVRASPDNISHSQWEASSKSNSECVPSFPCISPHLHRAHKTIKKFATRSSSTGSTSSRPHARRPCSTRAMNSVFSLIVVSTILSVVSAKATPAPAPPTPPPPAAANPALVGQCCAPGRCNTYTPQPDTDCASYIAEDGSTMNTANWKTCQSPADCVNAKNSCGGWSVGDYVPGEVCSATSKSYLCCVPGNQDSKGCSSGKNPTGEGFNSADWLECKYEKGESNKHSCVKA